MKALLIAAFALLMTGCATDMTKYYEVQQKAIEADNNVVMAMAAAASSGDKGALMWLAMRKPQGGQIAPPQDKALQWASILLPTVTNIYGINRNTRISLANINAETERFDATMGTLEGIATQGIDAAGQVPVIVAPSEGFQLLD